MSLRERFWGWLAWRLPRDLAYHATIRLFVHATTGQWSHLPAPDLTVAEALQRWEKPHT